MNKRERILAAINHEDVDKIPIMYRGSKETNKKLLHYFGILGPPERNILKLNKKLKADNLVEEGEVRKGGKYNYLVPKYIGPIDNNVTKVRDPELSFTWGIGTKIVKDKYEEYIAYGTIKPMSSFTSVKEIENYPSPKIKYFDFSEMKVVPEIKKNYFYGTGMFGYLFMLATWLRGTNELLLDMISEPKMAEAVINKIGELSVRINNKILEYIGDEIDYFVIWDDVADQQGMMMSPLLWRRYFKKWFKILITNAKKYNLIIIFHFCGNCNQLIPDLIEMGVDVLDPVQTSVKDMNLDRLKKLYGNNLCFHGGIDVQKLLPRGTVSEIKQNVNEAKRIFGLKGGLILGPSHYISPDTPIGSILAIYEN